jgi:hypothetical protein
MLAVAGGLVLGAVVLVLGFWAITELEEWVFRPILQRIWKNRAPQHTTEHE